MLKLINFVFFAALAISLQAAPEWLTDLPTARKKAEKEGKAVLLDFTGVDWCPPCKALKKAVLDSEEFKKFAEKNLILVELDFPINPKKLPKKVIEANEKLQEQYKVELYPTIVILDKNGKELGRLEDYNDETPAEYIKKLETVLAKAK
jgi:thioredoxin-related protein